MSTKFRKRMGVPGGRGAIRRGWVAPNWSVYCTPVTSTCLSAPRRTLFGDVARYAPGLAVPIIAGTLSTIIFARLATPEELGTFLLILASATTLGVPFGYWLQQAVLRLYPAYAETGRTRSFEQAVSVL